MHFLNSLFFLLIFHFFFLISFSNANDLLDDQALVAIAKGPTHFGEFCTEHGLTFEHINQLLSQKYETHIGILYFLTQNSKCAAVDSTKIEVFMFGGKQPENACVKYRKHVFIIYEYIFREYVGVCVAAEDPELAKQIPVVEKPNFGYYYYKRKLHEQKDKTLSEVLKSLVEMWKFFFDESCKNISKYYTLQEKYDYFCTPHLLNEDALISSYPVNFNIWEEQKELFKRELVKNYPTFDNSYSRVRQVFDKNMKELWNKVTNGSAEETKFKSHVFIKRLKEEYYGIFTAFKDSIFLTFVNDRSKFIELCNKLKTEVFKNIALLPNLKGEDFDLEKAKEILENQYGAYVGIMHLMVEGWQCEKQVRRDYDDSCKENRKYLDILYEYLLWAYNGEENSMATQNFPLMRPNFHFGDEKIVSIIDVLNRLAEISAFFFDPEYNSCDYHVTLELMNKEKFINENEVEQNQLKDVECKKEIIEEEDTQKNKELKRKKNPLHWLKIGKDTKKKNEQMEPLTKLGKGKEESLVIESKLQKLDISLKRGKEESSVDLNRDKFAKWLKEMAETATKTTDYKKLLKSNWLFSMASQNEEKKIDDNYLLRNFIQKAPKQFEELCKELEKENSMEKIEFVTRRMGKEYSIGETVKYIRGQYEAYLGVISLMKSEWNCGNVPKGKLQEACEEFKKYMAILDGYFFRIYIEDKNVELAKNFPAVIPIFNIGYEKKIAFLIDVVNSLIKIWAFYFHSEYSMQFQYKLENLFYQCSCEPKLRNKDEVNYDETFEMKIMEKVKHFNLKEHTKQKTQLKENKSEHKSKDSTENTTDPNKTAIGKLRKEYDEMIKECEEKAKNFSGFDIKKELRMEKLFRL